ncbi:MAG: thioredoxin-disulfide reductase [Methanosphaera sp. rholeuAM270]|nr:MAG: thioredoxin-disulfide reductase [Methanosphaera sp. rholeuAM270]
MIIMYDIIIIGGGPAGLTAGIYAGRAGLKALIIEQGQSGGTANTAPLVENYPGFEKIPGKELMASISKQSREYCDIEEFSVVEKIEKNNEIMSVTTNKDVYSSKYVILATGCEHRTLDVPGISKFSGRGVSYCAVCDGNFFVDREVIIVGGGNSAATEALYLNRIGVKCSIVHRRDKLRCDIKLQEDLKKNDVKVFWNSEIKEIKGEMMVEEAVLINNKTMEETTLKVNGVFIAVGNIPKNKLALDYGITCNEYGYVVTDENMKTSDDRIYAAGDVTGGMKQIVVSASQGAIATEKIQKLLI